MLNIVTAKNICIHYFSDASKQSILQVRRQRLKEASGKKFRSSNSKSHILSSHPTRNILSYEGELGFVCFVYCYVPSTYKSAWNTLSP